jgi:hypothetical protein
MIASSQQEEAQCIVIKLNGNGTAFAPALAGVGDERAGNVVDWVDIL